MNAGSNSSAALLLPPQLPPAFLDPASRHTAIELVAVKACSGAKEADRDLGRAIQQQAIFSGNLVANLYVANTAVHMLASCGFVCYAQHGPDEAAIALELFQRMTAPDRRTFTAALKACASSANAASTLGMVLANSLVDMYANFGSMLDARKHK